MATAPGARMKIISKEQLDVVYGGLSWPPEGSPAWNLIFGIPLSLRRRTPSSGLWR